MNHIRALAVYALASLALSGCTAASSEHASGPSAGILDPLTCYLDGDDTVDTTMVTLRCGGMATSVDLTATNAKMAIADWTVANTSVGVSSIGSSIVRVHTTKNEHTCTYYRDMADQPEMTKTDCQ